MRPRLFSGESRHDSSPRGAESQFAFLDRVDDPFFAAVRHEHEVWFQHYPREGQTQMRDRLFGRNEPDAHAAWWELLVHEIHWRQGWRATLEPSIGTRGRNPDFVWVRGPERLVMEAKVISGTSDAKRARDRRFEDLYAAIDGTLKSDDFVLAINVSREGRLPVAKTQLRCEVQPWLNSLRGDYATPPEAPERREFALADWVMTLTAFQVDECRRGANRDGVIAVYSPDGGISAPQLSIRHVMGDKGSRYGDLPYPFVVALALDEAVVRNEDVQSALFGDVVAQLDGSGCVVSTSRRANGYWTETSGQRVTAVLTAIRPRPWTAAQIVPRLWLNPHARTSANLGPWTQMCVTAAGRIADHLQPMPIASLLDLPGDWPPGEAFGSRPPNRGSRPGARWTTIRS